MKEFSKNFIPETTKDGNLAKAEQWLTRAVKLEVDGKSDNMISMAFNKALDYENAAFV